jgi:hypothetical protein
MIYLSLTELAFVVIGMALIVVAFFGWVSRWAARNAERRSLRHRIICRLCLAVFEDTGRQAVVDCPKCGAKTNRGSPQSLG